MAGFSGAVRLADLNDFIAPSQACVVNLEDLKKGSGLSQDFEVREVINLTAKYDNYFIPPRYTTRK